MTAQFAYDASSNLTTDLFGTVTFNTIWKDFKTEWQSVLQPSWIIDGERKDW